jgi:purine-binding chemotaxis protein CheW
MTVASIAGSTQYLTFRLEEELFALDIGKVREVLDFTTITKVPQAPDYMRGVINLRGSVVPVLDLRLKFEMAMAEQTVNTCVIIVEVEIEGKRVVMGAMVDAVQEVLDLETEQIEPPPRLGSKRNAFISGMGKQNDEFIIIILDIDQIFSKEELFAQTDSVCGNLEQR